MIEIAKPKFPVGKLVSTPGALAALTEAGQHPMQFVNGTSAEGGMNGLFNEYSYFNGAPESVEDILKHYDDLGGPLVNDAFRPESPRETRTSGRRETPRFRLAGVCEKIRRLAN